MAEAPEKKLEMARVASVINPDQVVINKGASDGVRTGQAYQFFGLGPDIKDPETGESLGQVEILRGNGKVIHTQNKISIVRSSRQRPHYDASSANPLVGLVRAIPAFYEDLPFDGIEVGDYARPI